MACMSLRTYQRAAGRQQRALDSTCISDWTRLDTWPLSFISTRTACGMRDCRSTDVNVCTTWYTLVIVTEAQCVHQLVYTPHRNRGPMQLLTSFHWIQRLRFNECAEKLILITETEVYYVNRLAYIGHSGKGMLCEQTSLHWTRRQRYVMCTD